MKNEGFDSHEETESTKSDEQIKLQTLVLKRYDGVKREVDRYSPFNIILLFIYLSMMKSLDQSKRIST